MGKRTGRSLRSLRETSLERGKPFLIPLPNCYVCGKPFLSEDEVVRVNVFTRSYGLIRNGPIHISCFKGVGMKVPGGYVVSTIDLRLKKTILLHLDENSNFKHKNRANTGLKSLDVDKAIYQQMLKWSEELESLKKTVARSPNKIHVIKRIIKHQRSFRT